MTVLTGKIVLIPGACLSHFHTVDLENRATFGRLNLAHDESATAFEMTAR